LNYIQHSSRLSQDEAIKTEEERAEVLSAALAVIKLPSTFGLPLRADMEVADLLTDKCKFMDSKKRPLWLVFENAQPARPPIYTIFKVHPPTSSYDFFYLLTWPYFLPYDSVATICGRTC
jgi:hypothetical protein